MQLTKYEHACVVLEDRGKTMVIDPGAYTKTLPILRNVVAVVVTHVHGDHLNAEVLGQIISANPGVQIFTTDEVSKEISSMPVTVAKPGAPVTVGPFALEFYGELHELVHPDFPRAQNIAVMVNNKFFFPGDSFTAPGKPIAMLAVPVDAPWLKFADTVSYLDTVKPQACIPTHNVFMSKEGDQLVEGMLNGICQKHNIKYSHLEPGESIEF